MSTFTAKIRCQICTFALLCVLRTPHVCGLIHLCTVIPNAWNHYSSADHVPNGGRPHTMGIGVLGRRSLPPHRNNSNLYWFIPESERCVANAFVITIFLSRPDAPNWHSIWSPHEFHMWTTQNDMRCCLTRARARASAHTHEHEHHSMELISRKHMGWRIGTRNSPPTNV